MYKKPQTETLKVQSKDLNMQAGTLQVSNGGGTNETHDNMVATAPGRQL